MVERVEGGGREEEGGDTRHWSAGPGAEPSCPPQTGEILDPAPSHPQLYRLIASVKTDKMRRL